jgi:hypothetical protein
MEIQEKSQVVDLRLDLHKQGISIGDDLDLVVNDQDQLILYFEPKRTIWSRFFFINWYQKYLAGSILMMLST